MSKDCPVVSLVGVCHAELLQIFIVNTLVTLFALLNANNDTLNYLKNHQQLMMIWSLHELQQDQALN